MNLQNDKALNSYIEHLIYQEGEEVASFASSDFKDANFIKSNKDKITKAMIYQWMKKHIRREIIFPVIIYEFGIMRIHPVLPYKAVDNYSALG